MSTEENESPKEKIKYSKFESSPEPEESDHDDHSIDYKSAEDVEDMSDEDAPLNLTELEQKDFEELTEEEKALLSPDTLQRMETAYQKKLISMLPVYYAGISGCRNVAEFENLNRIEEGTFGVVYRAVEKKTDEVVALKRLKMENEREGFPITSLREINMLLKCGTHPNIVNLREIVVGSNIDKIYLVMEYVDHDIKALMETMSKKSKKFTIGQVKTLMHQLLSGVEHMHQEFVIHRDLKTSNLLLTRNGILKIGDFGLAREFGDPLKPYTQVVVTLWYRSPELLLGCKEYSTAVDMWSVGCIFAEFLKFKPLFPGRGELDQLNKIFTEIGTPSEKIWPGYSELPGVKKFAFIESPFNQLKKKFATELKTEVGFELLNRLLAPCPNRRISATDALSSSWFTEDPLPVDPSFFPTFPSKSDSISKERTNHVKPKPTAKPTNISADQLKLMQELNVDAKHTSSNGFSLKFDLAKF